MQHELMFGATYAQPGLDIQRPFDAAVVIQSLLRDSLVRSVRSVYEQDLDGAIQILIGVEDPKANCRPLYDLIKSPPPNVAVTLFNPGYSMFVSNGGLHPAYGGVTRTVLSYAANSRYVAYLDDDNWWAPQHLSSLLAAMKGCDWAFSLRAFVDLENPELLVIDDRESVGPGGGIFNDKFGGSVDTSSLMIDKNACEPVLRLWSVSSEGSDQGGNHSVFKMLKDNYHFNCTFRPTSYCAIDKDDQIHAHRAGFLTAVAERIDVEKPREVTLKHLPGAIHDSARQWVARNLPKQGSGAVVGVGQGDFSALLLDDVAAETLHLIDPWLRRDEPEYDMALYGATCRDGRGLVDEAYDRVCRLFEDQLASGRVVIHRKTSADAVTDFKDASLDWIYIDTNQGCQKLIADLKAYMPKVKDGGVILVGGLGEIGDPQEKVRRTVEDFLFYSGGVELIKIVGNQFVLKKRAGALPEPMNPPLASRRECTLLSIKGRYRRNPFANVAPHDFKFDIAGTVDIGALQWNDRLSLYCLDDHARQFFFVETVDSEDLENSPFMYQTQFEQAAGLFAVPYEYVKDVAAHIDSPPIFIFSIGRVGSTHVSELFNGISEVRSFSEPGIFTQIADLRLQESRKARQERDEEIVELISLATRCLQPVNREYHERRLVIKHRSQANVLSDLFVQAFPQAKIIFLHREAESWARSAVRACGFTARQLAWQWRNGSSAYKHLVTSNANVLKVSYEELASDGIETFGRILEFCALPLPEDTSLLRRILDRDFQRDTSIAGTRLKAIDRHWDGVVQLFLKEIAGEASSFQE